MMNLKKSLINWQKIKLRILAKKHSAFIASIISSLDFIETDKVDKIELNTYKTDMDKKDYVSININWFNQYNIEEQLSIIIHVILHYALQHDLRICDFNPDLFQLASDQVVNNLLIQMGYTLPKAELRITRREFVNLTVESVYKLLEKELKEPEKDKELNKNFDNSANFNSIDFNKIHGSIGSSFGKDIISNKTDEIISGTKKGLRNQILFNAEALDKAQGNKSVGDSYASFESLFRNIDKQGELNWKAILSMYVNNIINSGLNYTQFNRRLMNLNLYLPDVKSINSIDNIVLALDISSSVTKEQITLFLQEISKIKRDIEPEKLTIITFNTRIKKVYEFKKFENISDIKMEIGGGTNIIPVFNYIKDNKIKPTFLIVFSDLIVKKYFKNPNYPVIWICIDNKSARPPYGKLIHINSKDL